MSHGERRGRRRRSEDRAGIMMLPAPWVGPALTVVTVWTAATRGYDYFQNVEPTEALAYLGVLGIRAWGVAFLTLAALLTVGLAVSLWTHRIGLLLAAHGLALGVYAAFTVALVQGLVVHLGHAPVSLRALGTVGAGAAIHYIRLVTTARAAPARGARL